MPLIRIIRIEQRPPKKPLISKKPHRSAVQVIARLKCIVCILEIDECVHAAGEGDHILKVTERLKCLSQRLTRESGV